MKKIKNLLSLLLIVCLIASLSVSAFADTPRKYKVTVSGGLYGTVNGQ